MKVGVYDIINDPLPKLLLIKEINISNKDLEDDDNVVDMMNKYFKMNKLTSEYAYALALTNGLIPKGIIYISSGNCSGVEIDYRKLAMGLLLIGAERFMCFHNHPGGNKKISDGDKEVTNHYNELGRVIGIDFLRHIMITQNTYKYCDDRYDEDYYIPFT